MKNIYLIFFFVCLIPTIFNSSDDGYYISVMSGINTPQCITDTYGLLKFQFSFYASTSGLTTNDVIVIQLAYPDYAIAECYAQLDTQEGGIDTITCSIDVANFPLLVDPFTYSLPTHLDSAMLIGKDYGVYIEKWDEFIGKTPNLVNTNCYPTYIATFTNNKNSPIDLVIDELGVKHLYAKGSFDYPYSNANQNYLTSSDPICVFSTYMFVDTFFNYYECQVYDPDETANSGDYTLHCAVEGVKKAMFFPTLSYSGTEKNYILVNIYGEVDLYKEEDDDNLSGTFAKLSGLLLLSLLLF